MPRGVSPGHIHRIISAERLNKKHRKKAYIYANIEQVKENDTILQMTFRK